MDTIGNLGRMAGVRRVLLAIMSSLWTFSVVTCQGNVTAGRRWYPLTQEQRLFRALFRGYEKSTRPVFNASDPVNVYIGITLTQIFDLDERNQVLTTNVWLDQEWKDEKLIWDPKDFDGIEMLRVPCKYIWKPDIVLYNSVEDYTDGYMQSLAMLKYDGSIFWPPIVKFQSTCQIDITYFPFDDQICTMKLGSWAYDGFQVDVHNRSVPVDLNNYISNGEWYLVSVKAKRNVVTYACCPEPFPDVVFTVHLRRRTLYYTHNVIIPCVMLSSLTLLIFWMSPDSGEKVTLGLTVLLAFSVFMLLIAENMPATSNFVPLIGMYLTTVMGITSLSVVLAVLVSNIAHRGRNEIPVPNYLRVVVRTLARFMCVQLHHVRAPPVESRIHHASPRTRRHFYRGQCENHASNDSGCGLIDFELCDNIGISINTSSNGRSPKNHQTLSPPPTSKSKLGLCGRGREDDVDAVLALLKRVLMKESDKDRGEDCKLQWQEAAEILDRFLFILFFIFTIVVTVLTLIVLPLTKPDVPEATQYK